MVIFSKTKSNLMGWVAFYIFGNPLMFDLIEAQLDSYCFCIWSVILVEVGEGNWVSCEYVVGKVSILRVFSYNLEYSLILDQNSTALLWGMKESEKRKWHLTIVMKIILTSRTPERDPWLSPDHTLSPPTPRIRLCSVVSQENVMTEWQL